MMHVLRVLDLFSGIGGFSLGLERTGGFKTVAFCEIERFCRRVLAKLWPEVRCYEDVRELTADRLAADGIAVDVICGGFPCQDISFAGRGAGLAGERSGLWREYARLIRELRPRVVVVENVAALLGRGLGNVLGDLAALGYDAWWDCIPASAVGAPHRRDRLWLVAYARGDQHQGFGDALRRSITEGLLEAALSHADSEGEHARAFIPEMGLVPKFVADPGRSGLSVHQRGGKSAELSWVGTLDRGRGPSRASHLWSSEPDVGRVAHGVPSRVDRLRSLGNAVVPQIPELIGRAILEALNNP